MSNDKTLTVDLTERSITLISSAIRHLHGKLQTNTQTCMTLAESMYDVYGDFEYSSGIEQIEEPFSKIISKTNNDLTLCDELLRAFEQFSILLKSQAVQNDVTPNEGAFHHVSLDPSGKMPVTDSVSEEDL